VIKPQSADEIRRVAMVLDDALESQDKEIVLSCFCDDAELEVFGLTFKSKDAIERTIDWMYVQFGKIRFHPIVIMVDGSTFFEEFILCATLDSKEIEIKAAEVLEYEEYKIKSLRLYIDRLEIAQLLSRGGIERLLVNWVNQGTLRGLPQTSQT
jgi:ketosteroid isomerase-like protein